MNSKKILIFSTAYYPFVGGVEVAIKEITDRIFDIEFDLITAKMKHGLPKVEKVGNVNVYRLGIGVPTIDKLILPFLGAVKTFSLNKKNSYNCFWCVMASFGSGAAYVANIFSKNKVPIVLTLQEGDSEDHFGKRWFGLINLAWGLALRKTQVLTAISLYLANRAREFGYMGEVKIIPNGVDIEKFSKEISKEEKMEIRKNLGIKEGEIALVTSSRLNVKNGIANVIEALTRLPENIKFLILGVGELESKLRKLAKDLNVSNKAIFKGFVEHSVLNKYLKACDIFIRPSLSEGMGNSFVEAMACKIPVIATPVGGIVDFLTEGETGYFCQPQDPDSIAETIKKVVSDPNKNQITENAYNMVVEKYDWNKIALQIKDILVKINL